MLMKTIWRILQFAPLIAIFGVLGLFGFYAYGMTRANITQSDGFTAITPEAVDSTLSGALPEAAIRIRHCYVSVGVAGRLQLYRFSAPIEELHEHAKAEFAAHWDNPFPAVTFGETAPFTNVGNYESGYGITADWMVPPDTAIGTIYTSSDGHSPHVPTIFVDETNRTLYFYMSD